MRVRDIDLTKKLADKIKELPEDNINEVIDFIEFLKSKKEKEKKRNTRDSFEACRKMEIWEGRT